MITAGWDSSLENTIDSAYKYPSIIKRKLHHKEKPAVILNRTKLKRREGEFQWDFYFLSNSSIYPSSFNDIKYSPNIGVYSKAFHRKGNCLLCAERGEGLRDVTLTLTGDHLIYN